MSGRKFFIYTVVFGGIFLFGRIYVAQAVAHLVISEVQVGGGTTDDEFIEIYNPTQSIVDISDWSIQYKGATGSAFSRKNFKI